MTALITRHSSDVDVKDLFCGAGGSSTGLVRAGMRVVVAANHSAVAIATHQANHPDTHHLCEDINRYEFRNLPRTRGLWASPICTEISQAGGKRRHKAKPMQGQTELFKQKGLDPNAFERTRATSWDVIRATEVHRYEFVLCENVVDWVTEWELFGAWRNCMHVLGYTSQIVSFNSAHVGGFDNPPAPQWRDRIYVVFTRKGMRKPNLELSPLAWCEDCGQDVHARQTWKRTDFTKLNGNVGRYNDQYVYTCPNTSRRHVKPVLEPYVSPALAALDLSDLGTRIGDRKPTATKPEGLAPSTMERIRAGAREFYGRYVLNANHEGNRGFDPNTLPLPTRTVKEGNGIVSPPLLIPCGGSWNETAQPVTEPMRTRLTREMEGVATPASYITYLRNHTQASMGDEPMRTVTAGGNTHFLVIPYNKNAKARRPSEPLTTITTHDRFGLLNGNGEIDVSDYLFRMLKPSEAMNAQGFPRDYIVTGKVQEQTAQAGNAVSVNVAAWIGERVMEVLG